MKFRVRYNRHKYEDCSDKPQSAECIITAASEVRARKILSGMTFPHYLRPYVGLIFEAVPIIGYRR